MSLLPSSFSEPLKLDYLTLCAVSSSNIEATIDALEASMAQVDFAEVLFFTHVDPAQLGIACSPKIRVIPIDEITSSQGYSDFILRQLASHITTHSCLIAQWDGHVVNAGFWREEFRDYDYIGASWPQFDDGNNVGNGGFSLRSRRLLEACQHPAFKAHHPEDVAICRTNRALLESLGLSFASGTIADQFSAERSGDPAKAFGFHGVFLMPHVLGPDRFWAVYRKLSDRGTVWTDLASIAKELAISPRGIGKAASLILDRFRDRIMKRR